MATTPWSTFYPYIQPHLPGCPEIVMEASLQEASAKFLERSEIWRFEIERDFAVKNVADYPIFIPTKEAVLENIYELVLDGQQMSRVSDKHIDLTRFTANGRPCYYTIFQDTSIRFYPTPDKKYDYKGGAKPNPKKKRVLSDKMKRRSQVVKKIMKEKGLKLIEASKYVKANNIPY